MLCTDLGNIEGERAETSTAGCAADLSITDLSVSAVARMCGCRDSGK